MTLPAPARRRALAALALGALAATGTACGDPARGGGKVAGDTLTVYSSLPLAGRLDGAVPDLVRAQKLALAEAGGRAGRFDVRFVSLDDTGAAGRWDRERVGDNARRAAADPGVIAYVGELEAAATEGSTPILNAAGVLQLTPGPRDPRLRARRLYPSGLQQLGHAAPDPGPGGRAGFAARFRRRFGRAPARGAERGYAAMRAVLSAIASAGPRAAERRAVVDAFRRSPGGASGP